MVLRPAIRHEVMKNAPVIDSDKSYTDRLPAELLLHIFGYLDQHSLGVVAKVCRRWRVLRHDASLYRVLTFTWPSHMQTVTSIRATLRRAPRLKSLTLAHQMDVDTILEEVATQNPLLRKLVLQDCRGSLDRERLSASILKKLLAKLPYLQYLKLKHCNGVTRGFIQQMGQKLPFLKSVSLHVREDLGSLLVRCLAENCPRLQKLQASCIFDDVLNGWSRDSDIAVLCDRLGPQLTKLRLNCGFWSSEGYNHLARCVNLKTLAMRYAFRLTEVNVYLLCKLSNLRTLDISMNLNINKDLWRHWLQSKELANLDYLSIVFCNLSDEMGTGIGSLKKLTKLRLVGTEGTMHPTTFDHIVMNCSMLTSIEFIFLGPVINNCLSLLPTHLPGLERLMVTPPVTGDILNRVQDQMPGLLILEDEHCIWDIVISNVYGYVFALE